MVLGWGSTNKLLHGVKYHTFNPSYRQQIKTDRIPNSNAGLHISTGKMFVDFFAQNSIPIASLQTVTHGGLAVICLRGSTGNSEMGMGKKPPGVLKLSYTDLHNYATLLSHIVIN